MEIWASANQKGGVGKTTTVVSLAGLLAEQGKRVLMVDLDPHGSLSAYFGLNPDYTPASVTDLFELSGNIPPHPRLVSRTAIDNLFVLPAATRQATLDRSLANKPGMGLVLKRTLQAWDKQFDHVLLDCPPTLGVLMINALASCQHVLIPVQTDFLALQGLKRMRNTLRMVGDSIGYRSAHTIIPTFYDHRTRAARFALQNLWQDFADNLWPDVIPIDTKFRDASRAGLPLSRLSPACRGIAAYTQLLRFLESRFSTNPTNRYQEAV